MQQNIKNWKETDEVEGGSTMGLSNIQESGSGTKENKANYGKLVSREAVENSPFTKVVVMTEMDRNCFLTIGDEQVTDLSTEEEIEEMLKNGTWTLIWNLAIRAAKGYYEVERAKDYNLKMRELALEREEDRKSFEER